MRRHEAIGWMTLTVAALLVGCADDPSPATTGTSRTLLSQTRSEDVSTPVDQSMLGASGDPELTVDLLGVNLGSAEAPVRVIEFVDFGCGYCRQFQLETFPALRAEFIETEMVEWKFLPFVSGMFGNSQAVSEAAECALDIDSRLFEAFSERLWVEQSDWKASDDAAGLARRWIGDLGGDLDRYDTCMAEETRLERVTSATAFASQLGVRATPTFWIVDAGPIQGALPLESFREILSTVHRQATGSSG